MLSAPSAHNLACSAGILASAASRSVCTAETFFKLGIMLKSRPSKHGSFEVVPNVLLFMPSAKGLADADDLQACAAFKWCARLNASADPWVP